MELWTDLPVNCITFLVSSNYLQEGVPGFATICGPNCSTDLRIETEVEVDKPASMTLTCKSVCYLISRCPCPSGGEMKARPFGNFSKIAGGLPK
jgi:hypothetical protein